MTTKLYMEKILGANWKTTVSGVGTAIFSLLTILAALPDQLGDIAQIIPPDLKSKVVTVGLIATFALRVWNAYVQKDKNVTGGTVQQTTEGKPAADGTQDLVDATVVSTIKSGGNVSAHQRNAVRHLT